ncbi:MAG: ABC transporter permease subunit [Planctomycetota bacterium]
MTEQTTEEHANTLKSRSDFPFYTIFIVISAIYVLLIVSMLAAETTYTTPDHIWGSFAKPEIRYAIWLSLVSCAITTVLSLWVSVPIGYLMSRHDFRGKTLIDAILDIPIVLPPLVIGLCLLIMFQVEVPQIEWVNNMLKSISGALFGKEIFVAKGDSVDDMIRKTTGLLFGRPFGVTYEIPSVILAQFMVACAFAVRTMRVTFDQIGTRYEQVALTLGCNRGQAFWRVVFPQA